MRSTRHPTVESMIQPCALIGPTTTCTEVDRAFRTVWACSSAVVRAEDGRIGLVSRTSFLATMAGRYGYGRSLWGRQPIAALAVWDVPTVRPTTTIAQAAQALADGQDGYRDLPVLDDDGHPIGLVQPVDVMQALAEQTARRAATDELTGVASRSRLVEDLGDRLQALGEHPGAVALAFIDLDRLKPVNDLFGHTVGDALLRSVARRLRSTLRAEDLLGRLGGDEFAAVRTLAATDESELELQSAELGEHLRAALAEHDPDLPVLAESTVSVGVALTRRTVGADALLRSADEAMYEAKLAGGDRVRLGGSSTAGRRTVSTEDLLLAYQPVIDVPTGQVVAVEALLRVRRANGALEFPAERLSTAARTGGTLALDRWVLTTACRDMLRWRSDLGSAAPPRVNVNLAPETIRSAHFAASLLAAIDATGLPRTSVCLELSEYAGVDDLTRATAQLVQLSGAGVSFALDDMGATLGALRLLGTPLPIDCVKVDRSVVEGSGLGLAFDTEMLTLVNRLAERFRIDVVAEGVETQDEDDVVRDSGIHQVQGFRHARPLLEADLLAFLTAPPREQQDRCVPEPRGTRRSAGNRTVEST